MALLSPGLLMAPRSGIRTANSIASTARQSSTLTGFEVWYQNGQIHRIGGPAITTANGNESWYQNGKIHRTGGPAATYTDGSEEWYQNGQLHRLDGPAVTNRRDGTQEWWENGERIR